MRGDGCSSSFAIYHNMLACVNRRTKVSGAQELKRVLKRCQDEFLGQSKSSGRLFFSIFRTCPGTATATPGANREDEESADRGGLPPARREAIG